MVERIAMARLGRSSRSMVSRCSSVGSMRMATWAPSLEITGLLPGLTV